VRPLFLGGDANENRSCRSLVVGDERTVTNLEPEDAAREPHKNADAVEVVASSRVLKNTASAGEASMEAKKSGIH